MFYIGLDLGREQDHTAIVVVERVEQRRAFSEPRFVALHVRHAEQAPLGTPFAWVVERTRELLSHPELLGNCMLAVDATGLGAPVVEMLRAGRIGCDIRPVKITGGERSNSYPSTGGTVWTVPKQDLISRLQVLLEREELKIAKELEERGRLVKELMSMRMTPGQRRGRVKYGADGCGEHDDLAIALSLACWAASQKKSGYGTQRLPGI